MNLPAPLHGGYLHCTGHCPGTVWIHKPATAATGGRVKKAGVCVKFWLAGIYFLVHAIFVASKLWIWQQFNFLAGQRASLY